MAVMPEQWLLPADRPLTIADLDETPDDGPGVEISDIQYRIPDPAVLTGGSVAITDTTVTLPPALVIEIASLSTASYDRNPKKSRICRVRYTGLLDRRPGS